MSQLRPVAHCLLYNQWALPPWQIRMLTSVFHIDDYVYTENWASEGICVGFTIYFNKESGYWELVCYFILSLFAINWMYTCCDVQDSCHRECTRVVMFKILAIVNVHVLWCSGFLRLWMYTCCDIEGSCYRKCTRAVEMFMVLAIVNVHVLCCSRFLRSWMYTCCDVQGSYYRECTRVVMFKDLAILNVKVAVFWDMVRCLAVDMLRTTSVYKITPFTGSMEAWSWCLCTVLKCAIS